MSWVLAAVCSVGFAVALARRRARLAVPLLVVAAVAFVAATVPVRGVATARYGGEACTPDCEVVAGGWPRPWVADHPGLSPSGSVSADGVVAGLDRPLWGAFFFDVAVFLALLGLPAVAAVALLRERPARAHPPPPEA